MNARNIPRPKVPRTPATPSVPDAQQARGALSRQEKAARLKAEMERARQAGGTGSAGAEWHRVQQGETLDDIAAQYGLSRDEVWNHKLNKQLRERRGSPDALEPGDALYIPKKKDEDGGPVGQGEHEVAQGECISSIAKQTGHFSETIWKDPANAELSQARKDPNVLLPQDKVAVPPRTRKWEPGETEMRHRFVRKGEPALFRLQVLDQDEPLANQPYTLRVDSREYKGNTDGEGRLSVAIPGNAKKGLLTVGEEPDVHEYELSLGHLDPITETSGVQARLGNLGFYSGAIDGVFGPETADAVREFQAANGLEPTGQMDDATREKLRKKYDDGQVGPVR